MSKIVLDISNLLAAPSKGGTYRVAAELIKNLPEGALVFARYDAAQNCLFAVPPRIVQDLVYDTFGGTGSAPSLADENTPLELSASDKMLVVEIFYEADRIRYYEALIEKREPRVYVLVYDLVPWLKPDAIRLGVGAATGLMRYLGLLLKARYRAFISGAVRRDFAERILRKSAEASAGEVIALGGDGIPLERQQYSPARRSLVCLGALDGKKGQDVVFEAFLRMIPGSYDRLTFIGKVPSPVSPHLEQLRDFRGDAVELIDSPTDSVVAARLRDARATIFISENEGFGLPAVESLFCGIPVIAHHLLPSLADLPRGGQVRLMRSGPDDVAAALSSLLDDGVAHKLWQGAAELNLPTWADCAMDICKWLGIGIAPHSAPAPIKPLVSPGEPKRSHSKPKR